jgi:membrane protein YdbS with pleckstrin-like domain
MSISAKRLGADEQVVIQWRTHGKALIVPAAALILVGGLLGAGTALVPSADRPGGQLAVAAMALALAIWWAVMPFLRWRTRAYTITNYRLIARQGILNKTGNEIPLMRINDVSYEHSLTDRMLGCGTLIIQTAADGPVVLPDVPEVDRVHRTITELLLSSVRPGPVYDRPSTSHPGAVRSAPHSDRGRPAGHPGPVRPSGSASGPLLAPYVPQHGRRR